METFSYCAIKTCLENTAWSCQSNDWFFFQLCSVATTGDKALAHTSCALSTCTAQRPEIRLSVWFFLLKKKKNVLPVESKTRQKQYEYHAEQGLFLEQNQDQNLFPVAKCMLWLRCGKKRSSSRTTDKPTFKKQMQEQRVRANRLGQEKENFSPIHVRNICVLLSSFCSFSQES